MAIMIAGGKEHIHSVLQGPDTLQRETIWQKMQQNNIGQNNAEDSVIGKAAEVQISKEGRKMYEDAHEPLTKMTQTDFMTEGEKKLKDFLDMKDKRKEYLKQADELQKKLDTDDSLTDKDKESIHKEIEELTEKGKSPDDKLHEMYQKKFDLKDELASQDDPEQQAQLQAQITQAEVGVREAKNQVIIEGALEEAYNRQVADERNILAEAKNKADCLGKKLDLRSSDLAMSVRTEEQVQEQAAENGKYQPTANDVIQAAVQEGKDRAEAQENDTEKLADGGLDAAFSAQNDTATKMSATDVDDTEAMLNRIKAMEKVTVEEVMV